MIVAEGLRELTIELAAKSRGIYGETMRVLWKVADDGAAIAQSIAASKFGGTDTIGSISPATYGMPYRTRQGVRAVWGPTTAAGRHMENGTAKMAPRPYLGPSLDKVKASAISELERIAGEL